MNSTLSTLVVVKVLSSLLDNSFSLCATVSTYLIPDAAVEEEILSDLESSNKQDSEDCAKRLICELYGSSETLAWDERLIKNYIQPKLDYASTIIQFQLAADLGRRQVSACVTVYSR